MKSMNMESAGMDNVAEKCPSRLEYCIENCRPHLFFWVALSLSGLCALLQFLPVDDVFARYAPAAEAFARGDWQYAFHPRFGVYFTSFAGIISWLFHCSGVTACQLLSMLCFSLTVFPLYALFREIWGKPAAFWGTLCYVFCSHLLRYAGEGLRDNGKTLALAMIGFAFVSMGKNTSWRNVIVFAAGNALLTVIRGEGLLIALTCGAVAVFLLKDIKKIAGGTLLFCMLIAPQCFYNYCTIGSFVPELRHGTVLQKLGLMPADTPAGEPEGRR